MKIPCIAMVIVGLLCTAVSSAGQDYTFQKLEEVSTNDLLFTRGLVSKVFPETQIVRVRPPKEKGVNITIMVDTVLEGFNEIGQLKEKDQVKVWYVVEGEANAAIRIVKMLDLGC